MSSIGHVVIASHPRPPSPTDDIVDRDADTEPSINGDVPEEEEDKIPTDPNHQKTALERLMEVLPDWPSVPEPSDLANAGPIHVSTPGARFLGLLLLGIVPAVTL